MGPIANDAGLRMARVIKLHRQSNTADLLFLDSGWAVPEVPLLCDAVSSRAGGIGHAEPSAADGDDTLARFPPDELIAACAFARGMPLVLGFLTPANCQLLFDRENFSIDRHRSDFYQSIDKAANVEWYHPSGTYVRIAADPAHEDLTAADHNGLWAIDNNTDARVHIHAEVRNGGATKAVVDIDPDGNVTVDAEGNALVDIAGNADAIIGGNATATVTGTLDATAGGATSLTCPNLTVNCPTTTFTGTVTVAGALASQTSVADPVRTMAGDRAIYNGHTHPGDSGGNTGTTTVTQ